MATSGQAKVGMLLALCGIGGVTIVILSLTWMATRGLSVVNTQCAWNEEQRYYVAGIAVRNAEPIWKVVTLRVQGRFAPPSGQRWPAESLRSRYEAISQPLVIRAKPSAITAASLAFPLQGIEGFQCSAKAWIAGQERFDQPPSDAIMDGLTPGPSDAQAN